MKKGTKKYLIASSVLVGSCIGAGVLGIPYVAAQSGFLIALAYIFLIGSIIFLVNLYLGEIVLRTKGDHQLIGYAKKYLGKRAKYIMEFAVIFGIYAALIAYMLGIGKSLSFLIFGNASYEILFGVLFGVGMAFLLKGGIKFLKRFEKIGVVIILFLLAAIFFIFFDKISMSNLLTFDSANILLPFGVILFALISFHAVPDVKIILKRNEKQFRKVMITSTCISIIFYSLFAFVVVGYMGWKTPQVATLALGSIFIVLGIFTMFTSYLASGNALRENFQFDERFSKKMSWFLSAIVPIGLFLLTQLTDFFSFITILSLGGVVSGGIMAILILVMVKKAKVNGNRKPEYSVNASWIIIGLLTLVFLFGVVRELFG